MANPQEPKVRLKFKKTYDQYFYEAEKRLLLPNGYRLATVEEIRNNIDIFKKWILPVKNLYYCIWRGGDNIRLLDGWMPRHDDDFDVECRLDDGNFQLNEGPSPLCRWIAVVKKKKWYSGVNKWWNDDSALYSSNGDSLRKHLYNGITLPTPQAIEAAWFHAYIYEDVELLYWLWQNHGHSIESDRFHSFLTDILKKDIELKNKVEEAETPLRKMLRRLGTHGPRFQLQMENAKEEARTVLKYAIAQEATWGVAMVELFIEVYGPAFVETAAAITFTNVESVPIFTKLLSLSLHQLEDQIPTIKPRFAEVLIEAVERGYSTLVEKMLEFNDIAEITTGDCVRVLRVAVGGGHIKLVRSLLDLLKSRDEVELAVEVDNKGKTLFHYALLHSQVFQLLQQTYAELYDNVIKRQDMLGRNILHWAAKGACDSEFAISSAISSAESLNILCHQRDDQGRTPLHTAASKGNIGMIEKLLKCFEDEAREKYIQETDSSGRTALHMAAGEGHEDSVYLLLYNRRRERDGHENSVRRLPLGQGSDPLRERDGHRKTALHHAAQVKDPKAAIATCTTLLHYWEVSRGERSLLLWASATGLGTADEMEDVHPDVKTYLRSQKERCTGHLLRAAAVAANAEMAWEILNRGADMADILDPDWRAKLNSYHEDCVKNVISHMERMKEQGRDQPSMEDKLGRHVFAEGLAALLLNRFIESPITVGISGEWGMGKSSLMIQTEKILLITAAQLTFPNLLPSEKFDGAKKISLNKRGRKRYQQIKRGVHILLALSKDKAPKEMHTISLSKDKAPKEIHTISLSTDEAPEEIHTISLCTRANKIYQQFRRWVHNFLTLSKQKSENPLVTMLTEYQPRYHAVYKSLACMDNNQMLQSKSVSQQQEHALRGVPRILTIRYNAWHYRDRHEAWAGLGVTIIKEMEKAMTKAQWVSTCWRYTWAKNSVNIWIQVFLPVLLSISLAGWFAWMVLMLLKQAKFQGLKYGSIPFTVIAIVWVALKSVISVFKPVSTQMLGYITSPDHTSHLGYQEDVISDINFLKKELGEKPHWFFSFILGVWCWNWFGLYADVIENTRIPKFMPASGDQIRIVTFVDDLDRCEEEVILQVLSAVNLVLAECKINVILGIDKKMIERAIRRKFEAVDDKDLAEKFICKIIQIPLSLPDPTEQETKSFLEYHLGHKNPDDRRNDFKRKSGIVVAVDPSREFTSQEEPVTRSQHSTVVNMEPCNEPEQECRDIEEEKKSTSQQGCSGIIKKAVDWLDCLLKFARNIPTDFRQPYEESLNSLKSAEGVRLIRELLLPNYTEEEAYIFYKLSEFASGSQKLPREWKRLLNYHKFAWYVLFRIGNVHSLSKWKEELIGWIFACWQWKHEMNHIIQNWHKYTVDFIPKQNKDGKQRYFRGPQLSEIVAKCMDQLKISESPVPEGSNATERQEDSMKLRGSFKQDPPLYERNERINEEGTSQNNWPKLQEALKIRDVSMEAIQLFQQFRFYCDTDHLPWHLSHP